MKKSKENDIYAGLYFKILYVQVRKFKEEIISLLGILGEMYEEAIVGHTYKSLEIDDILRAKLKKISEWLFLNLCFIIFQIRVYVLG